MVLKIVCQEPGTPKWGSMITQIPRAITSISRDIKKVYHAGPLRRNKRGESVPLELFSFNDHDKLSALMVGVGLKIAERFAR